MNASPCLSWSERPHERDRLPKRPMRLRTGGTAHADALELSWLPDGRGFVGRVAGFAPAPSCEWLAREASRLSYAYSSDMDCARLSKPGDWKKATFITNV